MFAFILVTGVNSAIAEVVLENRKFVQVDATWGRQAHYQQTIQLLDDTDVAKYKVMYLPKSLPDREVYAASAIIQTASGETVAAVQQQNRLTFPSIDVPAKLTVEFKVNVPDDGWAHFFVDQFKLSGHHHSAKEYYKTVFPKPIYFQWAVQAPGQLDKVHFMYGDNFEWRPSSAMKNSINRHPVVKISTVESWSQIKVLYSDWYEAEIEQASVAGLMPMIQQWRQQDKETMLLQAAQYIRQAVTYKPHPESGRRFKPISPDELLKKGRGDCKDIAALAGKVFRLLGLEAYPVLCAPKSRYHPDWPDPFIFHHAVVKIITNQDVWYYDLTRSTAKLESAFFDDTFLLPLDRPGSPGGPFADTHPLFMSGLNGADHDAM